MTEPDDRELQDYLKGDSRLSRADRKASAETTPPLDQAALASSRAELKRKPDWSRALAPYALAASLLLGVNLAWNVYQAQPSTESKSSVRAAAPAAAKSALAAPEGSAGAGAHPALTEEQKIDRLIDFIGALNGAVFIRNGGEHSPQDAVEHLRLKRRKAGIRVRTAQEFIERCATRSSISGAEYQIRFADGRIEPAAGVLRRRLAELEN